MFKILLTTHGEFCTGIKESTKIFSGSTDNITAIPFYTEDKEYDPDKKLEEYINNISDDDIVVILTDILWGSVNQKVYLRLNDMKNVHIITGLNLPLLLEIITMNPNDINSETISEKVLSCKESIVYMKEYEITNNSQDE